MRSAATVTPAMLWLVGVVSGGIGGPAGAQPAATTHDTPQSLRLEHEDTLINLRLWRGGQVWSVSRLAMRWTFSSVTTNGKRNRSCRR